MRSVVSVLFVLLVVPAIAQAQPGPTAPPPAGPAAAPPPPAAPQPYPPPPPGQPAPYGPQPYGPPPYGPPPYPPQYGPVQLTPEEQSLLAEGEISIGIHAGGVAADWLIGFGIGQAIQGRWSDTGWIFTLGEVGGLGMLIYGVTQLCWDLNSANTCDDNNAGVFFVGGLVAYMGFHVWSIVDAAIGPAKHNRKVRELKRRIGLPVEAHRVIPYTMPTPGGGATAGLTFRF